MAEDEVRQLKQKLENYQIEFENYKIECKQLQSFLEEEASKKEDEIRQLKQDAIKRQKQLSMAKTEINALQSEINNLKGQLSQSEVRSPSAQVVPDLSKQLQQLKKQLSEETKKIFMINSQKQSLQNQLKQNLTRGSEETLELKEQIKEKDNKIKALNMEIQQLKSANSQKEARKTRTVEIKIEKTKPAPSPQEFDYLKEMLLAKEDEVTSANAKINKLIDKIIGYEKKIIQLEEYVNNGNQGQDQKLKTGSIDLYAQRADGSQQQEIPNFQQQPISKTTMSVLIVTKKYYSSPFLEMEGKNTIRLYKTDKNGRIDKSLGSFQYKLNAITYNEEQVIVKSLQKVYQNIKERVKNRIIIYGIRRTNKKGVFCEVVSKLRNFVLGDIGDQSQSIKIGVQYMEIHGDFVTNVQIQGHGQHQINEIFNFIERMRHQDPKTPKKHEKDQPPQNRIRYFCYYNNDASIQVMSSNFVDVEVKQNLGLTNALQKTVYSKIPHYHADPKAHIQIILTLNPIVGFYEGCRKTLRLANCRKKMLTNSNVFDWRESPAKKILVTSSRNDDRAEQNNQGESIRISRMTQKVQFYRVKLNELIVTLKVMLSTHIQASYLKKSPTILNLEKILRFVQSILNQGSIESISPRKQGRTITIQGQQYSP